VIEKDFFLRIITILVLILGFYQKTICQTKSELESEILKNKKDIEYTTRLLGETTKSRKESYNKLLIINKRIKLRSNLIEKISDEIINIEKKILNNKYIIESLEEDLKKIKKEYANMIYYAYKNKNSYDRIIFIISAKDFNQAYKRIKYLQQYTKYRKKQGTLISAIKTVLKDIINELGKSKNEKEELIQQKNEENKLILIEKKEQDEIVIKLGKKEKELKAELRNKERIARKLREAIEEIITEKARSSKELEIVNRLTPEERIISDEFRNNKGRLPWPTENGVITTEFGEHEHPVLKGIKVKCSGVDISTTEGSIVRAIFGGEVSRVFAIRGANMAIIIRHGDYLTVYQNLIDVKVKVGDKVKIKQTLGIAYTDKENGNRTTIHIQIWEENKKGDLPNLLDPSIWISQK